MHFAQKFAQKAAFVALHCYIGINVGLCINACDMKVVLRKYYRLIKHVTVLCNSLSD